MNDGNTVLPDKNAHSKALKSLWTIECVVFILHKLSFGILFSPPGLLLQHRPHNECGNDPNWDFNLSLLMF